jgi:hypothetical protein
MMYHYYYYYWNNKKHKFDLKDKIKDHKFFDKKTKKERRKGATSKLVLFLLKKQKHKTWYEG